MSHTLYTASVQRVQRCELAVPGSNPDMFEKALKSGTDFIFLDLEDAVAPDAGTGKAEARDRRLPEDVFAFFHVPGRGRILAVGDAT